MLRKHLVYRAFTIAALILGSTATYGAVIADSVTEFSGTQGSNGWYYLTDLVGTQMTNFRTQLAFGIAGTNPHWSEVNSDTSPYTKLWATGGHSSSTSSLPVRRWVSDVTGPVLISANYQKLDNNGGDGTSVQLIKNGTEIIATRNALNNQPAGLINAIVQAGPGDTFDFVIYSGPNGTSTNVNNDSTTFTAQLQSFAPAISLNFASGRDIPGPAATYALASTDYAGVVLTSNWNNLTGASGTQNNLMDQGGGNSGASVTWNSNGTWDVAAITQATSPNHMMMKSHLDARSPGDSTITVSNLPNDLAQLYDVYVYFDADTSNGSVNANYTIGSTTYYISDTSTFNGTFVRGTGTTPGTRTVGANYVVFRGLTGSSFTLLADSESFRAEVSGIQIMAYVVPEPSSITMLMLGGALMLKLFLRKRHNR